MFWEVLVGTLVRAVMLCTLRLSVQSTSPPVHRRRVAGGGSQKTATCKTHPLKWRGRLASGGLPQHPHLAAPALLSRAPVEP